MPTIVTTAPGVELDRENHPRTPPGPHKPPYPQFPAPIQSTATMRVVAIRPSKLGSESLK
eukprot:1679831-Rhodomonas_salina.1